MQGRKTIADDFGLKRFHVTRLFLKNINTVGIDRLACTRVYAPSDSPSRLFADLPYTWARLTTLFGSFRGLRSIELTSSKHSPVKSSMLLSSDLFNSKPLSSCRSARDSADRAGLASAPPRPQ